MDIFSNKKFVYGVIIAAIVILVVLVYFAFIKKSVDQTANYEVMDSNTIVSQIIKSKSLDKDSTLYSDQTNGTLKYSASEKSFILQLPQSITSPEYNRKGKIKLENYTAQKLNISINQLCVIPFSEESSDGEELYVDVCIGEE
jgi:cytoskeletal protein RodZ